ncbi:MAG TPA: hypothetical protein VFC07_09975 [Verrucomicrobiae bacterium]|nr:hypothetical protein [Verrucomicrobiae bacterium]
MNEGYQPEQSHLGGSFLSAARQKASATNGPFPYNRMLRQKTTMTLTGIAKRLNMGTTVSLANLLRDAKRK